MADATSVVDPELDEIIPPEVQAEAQTELDDEQARVQDALKVLLDREPAKSQHARVYRSVLRGVEDLPLLARLAARMEPAARNAFLAAVRGAAGVVDLDALAEAVGSGQVSQIEAAMEMAKMSAELQRAITPVLGQTFALGVGAGAQAAELATAIGYGFNLINPGSIAWVRQRGAELVTEVTDSQRAAIREVLHANAQLGRPVRDVARDLREMVGLREAQAVAVDRFRQDLEDDDLEPDVVARRVARYAEAQLRYRAETIARTETIAASAEGQEQLWRAAVHAGKLDPDRARRRWIVTPDDRLDLEVCFPARTPVLTMDGWKPISRLKLGEYVMTHQDRFRPVMKRMARRHDGDVVRVLVGGRSRLWVTATANHPFLTNRGWVAAGELSLSDELAVAAKPCTSCGNLIPIGPGAVSASCRICSGKRGNDSRWADPAQHAALRAKNIERWALTAGARWRPTFNVKLPKPPVPRRIYPATVRRANAAALVAWRRALPEDRQADIQRRAISASGSRCRGGSYIERRVRDFLEGQGLSYEAQWPYAYADASSTRRGYADFYLPGADVVIECDGGYHREPDVQRLDELKTSALRAAGHTVLRFTGRQITREFHVVASAIREYACIAWVKPKKITRKRTRHQPVYNLEVADDHSYVAGGFVVHNCEPLDGVEVELGEPFPGGIMRPPAHPNCRCSVGLTFKKR